MKLTLANGQQSHELPTSGQFIYVKSCPSLIEVKAQTKKGARIYQMTSREQVQVPPDEAFTSITVLNRGDTGEINIETGFGQFVPALEDLPIKINFYDENGDVEPLPMYFPQVPEVQATQKDGDVYAVEFPVVPEVIASQKAGTVFKVESSAQTVQAVGTGSIILDGSAVAIAANPIRKELIIQAPEDNSEDVVIGGFFHIRAGATEYLKATNTLNVSGQAGDQLYVGEVV
ncbi:hypothetical protein ACXHQ9_09120 [Vibrio cincinnatiensis]